MNQVYLYHHPSGMNGVGFVISYAGKNQHSVAWDMGPAARYMNDELESHGITCKAITSFITEGEPAPAGESTSGTPVEADLDGVQIDASRHDPVSHVPVIEPHPAVIGQGEPPAEYVPNPAQDPNVTIKEFLERHPDAEEFAVIEALHKHGIEVSLEQVRAVAASVKPDPVASETPEI